VVIIATKLRRVQAAVIKPTEKSYFDTTQKKARPMTNLIEMAKRREALRRAVSSARFHDVGGRQLMLCASGTGGPVVVVLPGAGLTGLGYLNLHEQVSRFTTSVLYDRAGTGWSDHVQLPRSATEVAEELRLLLRVAGVPAPYVFVGHSLGGIYARRFAQRFPADVAGVVFLDPGHEDYTTKLPKPSLGEQLRMSLSLLRVLLQFKRLYRGYFERMFADWPAPVRDLLFEYHRTSWRVGLKEAKNFESICDEVRRGGDMPDVPLIVLTAMGIDPFRAMFATEASQRKLNDVKLAINRAIANSVPHGEHRVLENAAHATFHVDRPDAVVQAIREFIA
jgi:pimeloyl-ACP methyl ester carboxylesterase